MPTTSIDATAVVPRSPGHSADRPRAARRRLDPAVVSVACMMAILGAGPALAATPVAAPVGKPLLARCWTRADLVGLPGEDAVGAIGPAREAPPPELPTADPVRGAAGLRSPLATIRAVSLAAGEPVIALSFNLIERPGELAGYDAALIDLLRQAQVPATFFASGRWMQSHPERARQLMADPLFELGSLGWDHRNLAVAGGMEQQRQWRLAEAMYRRLRSDLGHRGCTADAAGRTAFAAIPAGPPLLRFPYGRCDAEALATAGAVGVPIVQWSIVLDDIAVGADLQTLLDQVRADLVRVGPGAILVGHADGRGRATVALVQGLLTELKRLGYGLVSISTLLKRGSPVAASTCFEQRPGDNLDYDRRFAD